MIVFIDYILVYSKNEVEHTGYLRFVMQVLKEHQLFSKYSKCEFWFRSVSFLGHIISTEDIEVDPKKINVVKNFPRPLNPIDIRCFLGKVGYYWRFVDAFASIASPLTTLTEKSVKFEWLEACVIILQVLNDRLTSAQVLTLLEDTNGYVVYCDTSRIGLGFPLLQHGKVVAY